MFIILLAPATAVGSAVAVCTGAAPLGPIVRGVGAVGATGCPVGRDAGVSPNAPIVGGHGTGGIIADLMTVPASAEIRRRVHRVGVPIPAAAICTHGVSDRVRGVPPRLGARSSLSNRSSNWGYEWPRDSSDP